MMNYTAKAMKSKEITRRIAKQFEKVGLFQRKRKFKNTKVLSQVLLKFISIGMSFLVLSMVYQQRTNINVSTTAFKKMFQKSNEFKAIYENLLNSREYTTHKTRKVMGFKRCFLLDTTSLKEEGQAGEVYRIHSSYALTNSQISSVNVTDSHTAENVKNFEIQENALYLADRAYCTAAQMTYMFAHGADFIFRMKYNGVKLYADKTCKKRFDVVKYLMNCQRDITTKTVYIQQGTIIHRIKIVAKHLGPEVTQSHQKTALRKAGKRGDMVQPETLDMCEWLILATSLHRCSPTSILKTYRFRWQIELLFKRFKTFLNLHKIRKSSRNYAFSYIFIALIFFFALELFVEKHISFFNDFNVESIWSQFSFALAFYCYEGFA